MTGRLAHLWSEFRRRRVVRVAVIYIVVGWVVIQVATTIFPPLEIPAWGISMVVALVLLGLPIALVLSWFFDIRLDSGGEASHLPVPRPDGTWGSVSASVEMSERNRAMSVPASPPAPPAKDVAAPLLAVIPFLNMSSDPGNAYFADGITEDVIAQLSKIRALRVVSRTSVMQFKERTQSLREIAGRLGTKTIVDGSVRRDGERVRIVAQLIDAETDQHLWAETYDRELTDIFAIQTDVALRIAGALSAELSQDERGRILKEPTHSVQAYQLYLRGRQWYSQFTADSLQKAIEYFERAVGVDPSYALAYAAIGMVYGELAESGMMAPEVAIANARKPAERALQLDPDLSDANCTIAYLKGMWDFDWAAAETGYLRAIELSPNNATAYDLYGRMCDALGRFDEAVALHRRAQELDPLVHRTDLATSLIRAGRYAEAASEARRAVESDPEYARGHATLGWAHLKQGREEEGLAALEQAVELSAGDSLWLGQLGQALALVGRVDQAREVLRQLESRARSGFVSPYHIAYVHTGLGEHDEAIGLLEQAFEQRSASIYGIKGSFLFAPLHAHTRFRALLTKMNLA